LRFLAIILRVLRLKVSVYIVLLRGRGGGGINPLEVTVNSKEESSYDFCPNDVQEFGLWKEDELKDISGIGEKAMQG
jgi:hypothetical protein